MKIFRNKYIKSLVAFLIFIILIVLFDKVFMYWYVGKAEVKVINVIGLSQDKAIGIIKGLNLEPVVGGYRYDSKFPPNTVILQRPEGNSVVKEWRRVYLILSRGDEVVDMPNVRNKSVRDASFIINRAGLILGETNEDTSDEVATGLIIRQSIPIGKKVPKGTKVNLIVSSGSLIGDIEIPSVVDKSLMEAEKILKSNKLVIRQINYQVSSDKLPNTVIDQFPRAGEKVKEGSYVDLFVVKEKISEEE